MIGSVIRYIGMPEVIDNYPNFKGHVGYITQFTPVAESDGKPRLSVRWFEPLPVHGARNVRASHFALERFEVLSDGNK
jgi:hypothetical protein